MTTPMIIPPFESGVRTYAPVLYIKTIDFSFSTLSYAIVGELDLKSLRFSGGSQKLNLNPVSSEKSLGFASP
jgi:hypothetical protein